MARISLRLLSTTLLISVWSVGLPAYADGTPDCNDGTAAETTECGTEALANQPDSSAIGVNARATGNASTAVGTRALAAGTGSSAFGTGAFAPSDNATSIGAGNRATGVGATSVGAGALATGSSSVAVGAGANALSENAIAIGAFARANSSGSIAIGQQATATGANAVAIGQGAVASADGQIAVGGTDSTVRMSGLTSARSQSLQSGPIGLVTTDQSGNLAADFSFMETQAENVRDILSNRAAISANLAAIQANAQGVMANAEGIRANEGGIAAALALDTAYVPLGQTFAVSGGFGFYEGENAIAGSAAFRMNKRFQFNAGLASGLNRGGTGGRAGFQASW
jgi:autotransporter adhesin